MSHFDLAVIGSGSGNTLVDRRFADWSVALIDDGEPFGGTCLNHGCIPTKMLVIPADLARTPAQAERLGVRMPAASADWPAIRERVFGRLDPLAAESEEKRSSRPNITLLRATARFVGPRTLRAGEQTITADHVVIAAGSRPVVPELPGWESVRDRVHTSQTIMRVAELPRRLLIVGGGYIAAEFGHVLSAFGTAVTVVVRGESMLAREDAEIAGRFTRAFADVVDLRLGTRVAGLEPSGAGVRATLADAEGARSEVEADAVLVAVGRVPNGDRLDVAAAGVELDADGFVVVDARQATTADGVWALGDVCSRRMLKHVANHEARVVAHNLLHPDDPVAADHRFVPHAVFSHPYVAAVGLTEAQAREAGIDVATKVQEYRDVAYGWALEDRDHCVKLVADRATGRLVGAHIIGPQAPDLLQPLLTAMSFDIGVQDMARGQYWIHPALSEVVENALLGLKLGG